MDPTPPREKLLLAITIDLASIPRSEMQRPTKNRGQEELGRGAHGVHKQGTRCVATRRFGSQLPQSHQVGARVHAGGRAWSVRARFFVRVRSRVRARVPPGTTAFTTSYR